MACNSSRFFSLQSPASNSMARLEWKALLLAGSLSGAFAENYVLIHLEDANSISSQVLGIGSPLGITAPPLHFKKESSAWQSNLPTYDSTSHPFYLQGAPTGAGLTHEDLLDIQYQSAEGYQVFS